MNGRGFMREVAFLDKLALATKVAVVNADADGSSLGVDEAVSIGSDPHITSFGFTVMVGADEDESSLVAGEAVSIGSGLDLVSASGTVNSGAWRDLATSTDRLVT